MIRRYAAAAVFALSVGAAGPLAAQDKIVTIGTGSVIGVYYPAGGAICRLVNRGGKEHGIRCYAESTAGSRDNLQALREGELSFAISQADWQYRAYHGKDAFAEAGAFSDLRSVFSLHSEMFTVAVGKNSGIRSFADLRGKRVNIGDASSGMREMMNGLLNAYRWKSNAFKTLEMKLPDAAKELCAGKIDAMVVAMGHPNGLVQEVTTNCGAKLIPMQGAEVDAVIAGNPYYSRSAIPGGMYPGNPQNISTFGMKAGLVTTASMDEEAVYQLTKAVFENFDSFKTLHFVFATLDRDRMVSTGLIAPLHPGALRYYREVGLIKE